MFSPSSPLSLQHPDPFLKSLHALPQRRELRDDSLDGVRAACCARLAFADEDSASLPAHYQFPELSERLLDRHRGYAVLLGQLSARRKTLAWRELAALDLLSQVVCDLYVCRSGVVRANGHEYRLSVPYDYGEPARPRRILIDN